MDTDALTIYDEENNVSESDESKKNTSGSRLPALSVMLKNNPEIPDALRDLMPYFSPGMRPKIAQMAALSDFVSRMSDTATFSVSTTEEKLPLSQIYGTVKKYIPMDKRQNIDGIMSVVSNIKTKMQPKPAANGLENIINLLTGLNEANKLAASAGAIKKIAGTIKNPGSKDGMNPDSMISVINSIMDDDKMKQISSMLGKLFG